jgi:hypothetical protein
VNPCTSGPCDGRRSHGWAQIYNGPASLDHDAMQTGLRAVAILRQSKALCPAFPFAVYARGTFGCSSIEAQRISRMREKLARSFVVPGDADD